MSTQLATAALLSALTAISFGAGERPNIVYFFADDLGWAGVKPNMAIAEANGTNMDQAQKFITPNIDSIVSGGINFTHSYGNPVCSPSRSCQQTGFHQGHTWSDRNDPDASKAMRTQDPTLGKLLDQAGYRNGMYGKWGYGATQSQNSPVINNVQTLPVAHGYHDCLVELHHVRAHTFNQPSLWYSFINDAGVVTTDTELRLNDNTYPSLEYSTGKYFIDDLYAEAAKDFIGTEIAKQKVAAEPKPFFAQVSFQVPHSPFADIENTVDGWFDDYAGTDTSTWTSGMKRYAAMVTHMDKSIGEILDLLADPDGDPLTDDSVMDNTLIIFASDNGGANDSAPQAFNINGHLRNSKGHVFEGGIRVPLAFQWNGVIAPGQTSTRRVCVTDILPTFCELAGVEIPVGVDGTSFAPLLSGTGTLRERPWLAYEDHNNGSWDWALIKDNYKLVQNSDNSLRLYKIDTDEDESQNRAGWQSEQDRKAEMLAIARAEKLDENDDFANVFPNWIGGDGADINNASSWEEVGSWTFSNKWPYGDTPQDHWNAVVDNTAAANRSAVLNDNLTTLGFELSGNRTTGHTQTLTLGTGISLTGRNEIRLSPHAVLELDGGTLSTTRHLGIGTNATLRGAGTVAGDLENDGTLEITPSSEIAVPGNGADLIRNGGFENGGTKDGGNDYPFSSIDDWYTESSIDPTSDAAVDGGTNWGTYRGLMHGTPSGNDNIPLIQDTGVPILLGDTYTLSFQHDGKSGWNNGSDAIRVRLFFEDGGLRTDLLSTTVTPDTNWSQSVIPVPAITNPDAVGKTLQLMFIPDQDSENGSTEWASVDEVSLTRNTAPTIIPGSQELTISGDFTGGSASTLSLSLASDGHSELDCSGTAALGGTITLTLDPGFTPDHGDSFEVLDASSVSGAFDHPGDQVMADTGQPFDISYGATTVTLTAIGVTTSGVPYDWLEENGLVAPGSPDTAYEAAAAADSDGDGLSATDEFITGTNPMSGSSFFAASVQTGPGDSVTIEWPSLAGREYSVLFSDTLSGGFAPYSGPHPATPPTNDLIIPIGSETSRFFVISAQLAP